MTLPVSPPTVSPAIFPTVLLVISPTPAFEGGGGQLARPLLRLPTFCETEEEAEDEDGGVANNAATGVFVRMSVGVKGGGPDADGGGGVV